MTVHRMLAWISSALSKAWQEYLDDGTFDPEAVLVRIKKRDADPRMTGGHRR